jgi:hypothetical protein
MACVLSIAASLQEAIYLLCPHAVRVDFALTFFKYYFVHFIFAFNVLFLLLKQSLYHILCTLRDVCCSLATLLCGKFDSVVDLFIFFCDLFSVDNLSVGNTNSVLDSSGHIKQQRNQYQHLRRALFGLLLDRLHIQSVDVPVFMDFPFTLRIEN